MINLPTFMLLNRDEQKLTLQSLIFSSEEPLSTKQISNMLVYSDLAVQEQNDDSSEYDSVIELENFNSEYMIDSIINEINSDLSVSNIPFRIKLIAGGWQFAIQSEYGKLINQHFKVKVKKKLSQAALETLAVICYKQPISKPEIEQIRGVNSNEVVNTLIDKNLIKIAGRAESLGKPLLYSTTQEFLRIFGLNSLEELPKLKEIEEFVLSLPENEEPEFVLKIDESDILTDDNTESDTVADDNQESDTNIE
ncbi:SMC-Scp complex subunit ScpB [Candidatus Kapaibacterium sp.]